MSHTLDGSATHAARNGNGAHPLPVSAPEPAHSGRSHLLRKCDSFTKAEELRQAGIYPYFRMIESAQDTEVVIDGKNMLMLGSNSYMGLTNDPRIKEAAIEAIRRYGSGCAGSRFLNGTLDIHIELEEQIADYLGKEAAIVYTTGYQTNLGVISALVGREDHVFIDRTDHASIVDGARLAYGKTHKFVHNDAEDLDRLMANSTARGKMIVVDGIYSMEGDIAKLPKIVEVARKHGASILVDDAHAVGVIGRDGCGTADHFGLTNDIDLIAGTFSKSLASIGGYVGADKATIEYLKHHSRALIFSASMAPSCVASTKKALEIIKSEPERRAALWRNTDFMREGLNRIGLDTGESESPIIPVVIGKTEVCFTVWRMLHEAGIFVNPVVAPATPPDRGLLRISVMATHTIDQLTHALEVIEKIFRHMELAPLRVG